MSSDSPPPPPDVWQSKNLDNADSQLFSKVQGFGNQPNYAAQTYAQAAPSFGGAFGNAGYNPSQTVGYGNYLSQQGQGMGQYGDQALQAGFDPQNDLYGRTAQNLQQQTRRALEARGVDSTPYGAGVEGQTMANFNLDWQDRALGRQNQAAQTATGLYGQGAQQIQGGQQMAQNVPTWQAAIASALQGMGNQNYQYPAQVIQAYQNYMGTGLQGDANANSNYGNQLKSYELEQQNSPWKAIGSIVGAGLGAAANPMSLFGAKLW